MLSKALATLMDKRREALYAADWCKGPLLEPERQRHLDRARECGKRIREMIARKKNGRGVEE
jgi:hypothetical protein